MDAVMPAPRVWRMPVGVGSLLNWLLCWLILPNLAFLVAWFVGGPPRGMAAFFTACVGIVLHRASFGWKFTGFVAALAYALLDYVGLIFNLDLSSLAYSLRFARELDLAASPEYVAVALMLVATVASGWFCLKRPVPLVRPSWIVGVAVAAYLFGAIDSYVAGGTQGAYNRKAEPGALFQSAVGASGLASRADGTRHVMVVMVEALGLPVDPRLRARLVAAFASPEVRARYEVSSGDTLFYGSTTSAELRELCGRWGDYQDLIGRNDPNCLPARLAAKGYGTQAWHGFGGDLFERSSWYPGIGFQEMRFSDRILVDGAAACPGVFAGACDADVPSQIAATLKTARKPQFVYWLTVNSHIPVPADPSLGTGDCAAYDRPLNETLPMACRLFSLIDTTGTALARQIAAPDFPPTDILIVGDHVPPFFDRRHRAQFSPDRVPWILLKASN